jgi:ABC-type phosphate/phosphonate transport system substrate-binding protein
MKYVDWRSPRRFPTIRAMNRFLIPMSLILAMVGASQAVARPRELILIHVGDENPEATTANLTSFGKLVDVREKNKPGTTKTRLFTDLTAAEDYIYKKRPGFALLPPYEFARLAKPGALEPIGIGVTHKGAKTYYWGVVRRDARLDLNLQRRSGLRLALPVGIDIQWVNVLMDGLVSSERHFKIVSEPDTDSAIRAVTEKRADLTFVDEAKHEALMPRFRHDAKDLEDVYQSPELPLMTLVTFKNAVKKKERDKFLATVDKLCVGEAIALCARLGFLELRAGLLRMHPHLAYKYHHYK